MGPPDACGGHTHDLLALRPFKATVALSPEQKRVNPAQSEDPMQISLKLGGIERYPLHRLL